MDSRSIFMHGTARGFQQSVGPTLSAFHVVGFSRLPAVTIFVNVRYETGI